VGDQTGEERKPGPEDARMGAQKALRDRKGSPKIKKTAAPKLRIARPFSLGNEKARMHSAILRQEKYNRKDPGLSITCDQSHSAAAGNFLGFIVYP